ncbi:MAG: MFS transporter [Deltaproteobacteria bacterium]|nr:MFS transporter [Deltaproteobacteria bacterium]
MPIYDKKKVFSWALYDWGNSAFATTVMAGFFPVFFKQYWSGRSTAVESTFRLGAANSIASLIIVVAAPVLGAIADRGSVKKRLLLLFAFIGILMTGALFFVGQDNWIMASALYVLGLIGFSGGNIFYDALLITVANKKKIDFVSALGFAFGYLGGGLLFAFNVFMTQKPELFGLSGPAEAVRISFISVALWWAVFTLPLIIFVKESKEKREPFQMKTIRNGFKQLLHTFDEIRKLKIVFTFLLGYWLYIDGVDTIVRMAVDYGLAIGFKAEGLVLALLITQFVGFPSAIAFGKIGERLGPKTGIFIAVGIYILITIWAYFMTLEIEFYLLAAGIGLVQGGVQSLSRSLYARIIPRNKSAEFFGFYNMLGKFAAVIGPVFMGWVGIISRDSRTGILSLIVLFVSGALLLSRVNVAEGIRVAHELE